MGCGGEPGEVTTWTSSSCDVFSKSPLRVTGANDTTTNVLFTRCTGQLVTKDDEVGRRHDMVQVVLLGETDAQRLVLTLVRGEDVDKALRVVEGGAVGPGEVRMVYGQDSIGNDGTFRLSTFEVETSGDKNSLDLDGSLTGMRVRSPSNVDLTLSGYVSILGLDFNH